MYTNQSPTNQVRGEGFLQLLENPKNLAVLKILRSNETVPLGQEPASSEQPSHQKYIQFLEKCGCGFFAYSWKLPACSGWETHLLPLLVLTRRGRSTGWKLPACSGAFLATVDNLAFLRTVGAFCLQF